MVGYAVMHVFRELIDWCFPPRPEELRVRQLTVETLTPNVHVPAANVHCLLPFAHPDVQALVHEAKFFYNRRAHQLIGATLDSYLAATWPTAAVIPIPLHPRRERARGFNQVTTCLTHATTNTYELHQALLTRTRDTAAQKTLDKTARRENVADAFACTTVNLAATRPIVIVDDVYTTGATMHAAQAAVTAAFPKHTVYCLTFAYA